LSLFFIDVPDYIGQNNTYILTQYELFTLDLPGEGDVVLDQRPKPGERVREGSVIELFLTSDN
jgi:stage V sporulation protein D (sporulation-specific penicillin-binding protein)